jgi:hypothetical protein
MKNEQLVCPSWVHVPLPFAFFSLLLRVLLLPLLLLLLPLLLPLLFHMLSLFVPKGGQCHDVRLKLPRGAECKQLKV